MRELFISAAILVALSTIGASAQSSGPAGAFFGGLGSFSTTRGPVISPADRCKYTIARPCPGIGNGTPVRKVKSRASR
jgi:hypothetical protein